MSVAAPHHEPTRTPEASLLAGLPATPVMARSGSLFLKLFLPPLHYGDWLAFMPDGQPIGVVDAVGAGVLREATGTPVTTLVAPEGHLSAQRLDAVTALLETGLLVPAQHGNTRPVLHWIAPDQQHGTRHHGASADLFIRWFHDYFGAVFHEGSPLIDRNQQFLPVLENYFPGPGPLVALDAGSGSGFYSAALARRGHTVYACDLSEARLAASVAHDPQRIKPVRCNIESIPLPDASVDFALCAFVLEHVADPYKVVEEMVRLLRPGGRILLAVPSFNIRDALAAHLFGKLPSLNFEHLRSYGLFPHTHPWCEATLDTLRHLESRGVDVCVIEGIGILAGLSEPFASGFARTAELLGPQFTTTWPFNCLGQQTIIAGVRR